MTAGAEPMRRRTFAAAGNAAALGLIAVLAAAWPELARPPRLGGAERDEVPRFAAAARDAPLVLVLVDGLRVDAVERAMPRTLARTRWRGRLLVESALPSTVAAIRTIVEGEVPPVLAAFDDFGARSRPAGGVLEIARDAGRVVAVAGPRLWTDLYGRWIDRSRTAGSFAALDDELTATASSWLASGAAGFVVLHLGAPDEVAHRSGAAAEGYEEAVRATDRQIAALAESAERAMILVTADHGVTGRGGHAGPEPSVRVVPLLLLGAAPPSADGDLAPQRSLHVRLAARLGDGRPTPRPRAAEAAPSPLDRPLRWLLAAAALLLAVAALAGVERDRGERAAVLASAVWPALALVAFALPLAAALVVLAALVLAARRARAVDAIAGGALAIGVLSGAARLAVSAPAPFAPRVAVGVLCLVPAAVLVAAFARRSRSLGDERRRAALLGVALALGPTIVTAAWTGPSVSLSGIDLRLAYRVVDLPGGIALAAAAVTLVILLPAVAVALALAPMIRRADAASVAPVAALVLLGQTVAAAAALVHGGVAATSLAIGLWVRLGAEVAGLFLTAAAIPSLGFRSQILGQNSSGRGCGPGTMPAMSGSSPSGRFSRSPFDASRSALRAALRCCFSRRAASFCRLVTDGLPRFAIAPRVDERARRGNPKRSEIGKRSLPNARERS